MNRQSVNMKVRVQSKRARRMIALQPAFHKELTFLKERLDLRGLSDLVLLLYAVVSLQAEREGKTVEEYLREFLNQIR
ncbi:MAG: hypothetical protein QW320_11185 [Ignisphaera sp.]